MNPVYFSLIIFAVAVLGGFWALVTVFRKRESTLRHALEENQKNLDRHLSRLMILMRALPNLQSLLSGTHSTEDWKTLFLDEARALVRADGASYWRYQERDQRCELDLARGTESRLSPAERVISLEGSDFGEVIQHQLFLTSQSGHLLAPLIIEGTTWGVFRFVKGTHETFEAKDSEAIHLFVRQLSLMIENQSLISNREKFYLELVQALADTLDARDASREGQTRQARILARGVAKEMGLPDEFIYYLEFAALMHDIGNIAIDEQILKKPGKLTAQEFELIKKHPEMGYKIVTPVSLLAPVAPMVLYHQEWFNGKGYPDGLAGEEIPLGARIVAVLDAWGGMTSHRPWRRALGKQEAVEEIRRNAGTQFDPKVVEAFMEVLRKQGVLADE